MARVGTHPGEVLREEFLAPLGMIAHQLAEAINVPPNRISEVVRENRSVTADTALRLAEHFRTTPEFWMNLQSVYDLSKARAQAEADAPKRSYFTVHPDGAQKGRVKRSSASGEFTKGLGRSKSSHSVKALAASALSQREPRAFKSSKVSRKDNPPKKK